MFRFLYNLLFPVALVLVLPGYIAKLRRRGNYRHKFWQRFGIYDRSVRSRLATGTRVWLHAVSVGEVAVALKLAATLRELDREFRCVLTTTTTTGFAFANGQGHDWIEVMYNPIDWWPITRRAFAAIRPAKLVLVEAEVWPNLVAIARRRGIPIALVNARLSRRSERRFRRFRFVVARTFRCLDLVCVQEEDDMPRWVALGIPCHRIRVVGSIKFDPEIGPANSRVAEEALRRLEINEAAPVLLGGSTHAGEEELLARVFTRLRAQFPSLILIIAPRHVERTAEIQKMLRVQGLNVMLRTDIDQARRERPDGILLNTTGELRDWYSVATVVFIGKSILGRGGQNPVEAIVAGKPVIFGPHMENFAALAAALLRHAGALQVSDADSLAAAVTSLLLDQVVASRMISAGTSVIAAHAGATARTVALLTDLTSSRVTLPPTRK